MKAVNVVVPGHAVNSDNETEIATAHYDYIPYTPLMEDSGVYLDHITYGGKRVPYTDEDWVDSVCFQIDEAESH